MTPPKISDLQNKLRLAEERATKAEEKCYLLEQEKLNLERKHEKCNCLKDSVLSSQSKKEKQDAYETFLSRDKMKWLDDSSDEEPEEQAELQRNFDGFDDIDEDDWVAFSVELLERP
uniref:Uncharacterized protein n=1 Tax=Ditylenchus dipsaci TaxID=166011 RepID=A0A915E1A6_9BILA